MVHLMVPVALWRVPAGPFSTNCTALLTPVTVHVVFNQ